MEDNEYKKSAKELTKIFAPNPKKEKLAKRLPQKRKEKSLHPKLLKNFREMLIMNL